MSTTDRLLKLAVSSVLALGATATTSAVLAQEPEKEQCAGIIKAFKNDCATSMMISFGDPSVFFTRPISAAFLIAAAALLIAIALPALRAKREEAMQE